jgi:pimeloyl-ACP methyl ester carboxylesterase
MALTRRSVLRLDDVRGVVRLAAGGVVGVTHIAEGLHSNILRRAKVLGTVPERPAPGITGFVYGSVRATATLVGRGLEGAIAGVQALWPAPDSGAAESDQRVAMLSALNGVMGDYLERTGNALAIRMQLFVPEAAGPNVVVMLHGLCMNERQWTRADHNHALELEHAQGWSPLYVRYNSGRHVSVNGLELAHMLESQFANWPVPLESVVMIGHSMGGLLARSAVHQANAAGMVWPRKLRGMVFLGTPHHGAPLERAGNLLHKALELSPYVAPFARLARIRSDGIADLRHGNLLQQDWENDTYAHRDTRCVVPLPRGVECFAVAGAVGPGEGAVAGDGLVPVASALGRSSRRSHVLRFPVTHRWVAKGVGHLDLLQSDAVCRKLLLWLNGLRTWPPDYMGFIPGTCRRAAPFRS